MSTNKKILLTGGSGFIGSEVVTIANARGYSIYNMDLHAPRIASQKEYWQEVDVRDVLAVEREVLRFQPDCILHLASDIDVSITSLSEFETTINGTANVLAAAQKLPNLKRFIHTSTQFVVRPGVEPKNERFLLPYTVYGEAKAEAEKLVWAAKLNTDWFILRPTIIWGPNHPSFAQQIFKHIKSRNYLHPVGPNPIMRAYGYVTNVADQMLKFAEVDPNKADRHVYYLGDESIDYDLWADAFSVELTGKRARRIPTGILRILGGVGDLAKVVGIKSPIDSGRAFRMSTSSRVDFLPTHNLIGEPIVSFEDGVTETMTWLQQVYGT